MSFLIDLWSLQFSFHRCVRFLPPFSALSCSSFLRCQLQRPLQSLMSLVYIHLLVVPPWLLYVNLGVPTMKSYGELNAERERLRTPY